MRNSALIHKAIEFAVVKHKDQKRKGTELPYIVHPIEVMQILTASGCTDEMIVAGILHDTVEDTDATINEVQVLFGDKVAMLVGAESEDKSKTWEERKSHTIAHLNECDRDTALCALADKLSNAISISADRDEVGNKVWERFNRPYPQIKWYYTEIKAATVRFSDSPIWQEYATVCDKLFAD